VCSNQLAKDLSFTAGIIELLSVDSMHYATKTFVIPCPSTSSFSGTVFGTSEAHPSNAPEICLPLLSLDLRPDRLQVLPLRHDEEAASTTPVLPRPTKGTLLP